MRDVIQNNVGHLRMKTNLTQEQLAERVGVTRQTIIALERGNYTPSVLLAIKIARQFKIPVEKLFIIE
jgi:putative transcriptional regulator